MPFLILLLSLLLYCFVMRSLLMPFLSEVIFLIMRISTSIILNFSMKALLSLIFLRMTLFTCSEECGYFVLLAVNVNLKGALQY